MYLCVRNINKKKQNLFVDITLAKICVWSKPKPLCWLWYGAIDYVQTSLVVFGSAWLVTSAWVREIPCLAQCLFF